MRPRQTHRIPSLLLGKLEAYSVLESMYLWLHITWITKESSQRCVLGQYVSPGEAKIFQVTCIDPIHVSGSILRISIINTYKLNVGLQFT